MGGLDSMVEAYTRWYPTWEPEGDIEQTIAAGRDGFERSRPSSASSAPTAAAAAPA
jgi:hypothetical protein